MQTATLNKIFTYSDYLKIQDDKHYELLEGKLMMSPAPSTMHQRIVGRLFAKLFFRLEKEKSQCEVFVSPFDVRLTNKSNAFDDEIITVVQPDIVLVCDKTKIDDAGCIGSPDLIIEVLSPSNAWKDVKLKFSIYEKYQIPLYWIVHPYEKLIYVYELKENKFENTGIFSEKDKIKIKPLNLDLDLKQVFVEV